MTDVQPPQRLDPQDILKLLTALRRALETRGSHTQKKNADAIASRRRLKP